MQLKYEELKYLCSEAMRPYLAELTIDNNVKQFCENNISWLTNPVFWKMEDLIILEFPDMEINKIEWDKWKRNKGSLVLTEWDFNHVDCINDYLSEIDSKMLRNVAFYLYNRLKICLKEAFPDYNFQVAISYDEGFDLYHLYFYRCRENESVIVQDVSNFMNPILAEIV